MTGASGFIGRRLVRRLVSLPDVRVRVLLRPTSSRDGLDDLDLEVVDGSLDRPDTLAAAARDTSCVFHLGGLTRARNRAEFMRVNATGTADLARIVRDEAPDLKRFVLVSSLAAIGPVRAGLAVDEDSPPHPITHYGASKRAGEEALADALAPQRYTIIRPPAVYGPGERDLLTVFRMVQRRFAPIVGFGEKWYSFVYVDDLVDALIRAAEAPVAAVAGRAFFVAHPRARRQTELLAAIESALGVIARKPRIPRLLVTAGAALGSAIAPFRSRPPLLTLQRVRDLGPARWVCDPARFGQAVGFIAPTDLEEGIPTTADWYREQGWL